MAPADDARAGTVEAFREAVGRRDVGLVADRFADEVHWYGSGPGGGCRTKGEVLATIEGSFAEGVRPRIDEVRDIGDRLLLRATVPGEDQAGPGESTGWFALTLDEAGRITECEEFSSLAAAERDAALRRQAAVEGAETVAPPIPVRGLVPFVNVSNLALSLEFYRLLGFEPRDTHEHEGRAVWAHLASEDAAVMLAEAEEPIDHRAQAIFFYLYSRDLEALRDHLVAHGQTPGEIVDGSPGPRREMRVNDPDGYYLMVAQIDEDTVVG